MSPARLGPGPDDESTCDHEAARWGTPLPPAIANALFALTGKPARRLPLSEIDWA